MNKFRSVQPMEVRPPTPETFSIDRLDGGLRTDVPARRLQPPESPDMEDVRFERGGMEKAYGSSDLGTTAEEPILGIIEHGFYDPTQAINVTRLLRFTRTSSGQGKLEIWNGSAWVQDSLAVVGDGSAVPVIVPEEYVSMVSVGLTGTVDPTDPDPDKPGKLFIASPNNTNTADSTKNGRILVRTENVGAPTLEEDDFPAGNSLTAAGETTDVTISKSAPVVENKYTVNFESDITITSDVDQIDLTILIKVDGVTKGTIIHSSASPGLTNIVTAKEVQSLTGNNFEIELDQIDITPGAGTVTNKESSIPVFNATTNRWEANKVDAAAADNDEYTFNYSIQSEPGGGVNVNFYSSNDGINWDFLGTESYGEDLILTGLSRTFVKAGLGASAEFGYEFVGTGTGGGAFDDPDRVTWTVTTATPVWSVSVHGFNKVTDLDPAAGVEWREEGTPTIELTYVSDSVVYSSPSSSPNPVPSPSFMWAFGDRLIALNQLEDKQILAASADGIAENWIFSSSVNGYFGGYVTALPDTRTDPIDPLQAGAPLTNDISALFRTRSIMRVFETGNFQVPIGIQHWIETVGTESPWSVQTVRGGIIFLGHDKQIYLLNETGLQPIGEPIRLDLLNAEFTLGLVEAFYDNIEEEYWLGIPLAGNAINRFYIFSMNDFFTEQRLSWRRESAANVTRPVFINGDY